MEKSQGFLFPWMHCIRKKADVSRLCEADCEKDSILTAGQMSFF